MMRSLYSGVSGMQNHQIRMDVIGNNVANVNTTGFKRGRVNFQDLISQQLSGASKPNEELGGVNPKEVGLGMMVASIDTIFTQGSLQTTGVNKDIAIQGNGFFVVKNGEKSFYTRAGNFAIDKDGTLVNSNGLRVQGWMAEEADGFRIINTSGQTEDLTIPIGQKIDAQETKIVDYACNLDKRLPVLPENANRAQILESTWSTEFKVYDSFGEAHELQIDFTRVPGEQNAWRATVAVDPTNAEATATRIGVGTTDGVENAFVVRFDNNGHLKSVTDSAGNVTAEAGQVMLDVSYNVVGANPDAEGNPTRHTFNVNLGEIGTSRNTITQFSDKSTTKAYRQDGYTMGYLENFRISQDGIITGVYTNGVRQEIGQLAMAGFTNQGGLEKAGENTYVQTNNSGVANISTAGTVGKGKFIGGTLEMSNVDLTDQFVDMIVTQKGFQAGAKTIQTSDTMLETVLNLKR